MKLNSIIQASIFTSLSIGMGFSLLLVPNVELVTFIVFTAGLVMGPAWGILVGAASEFVFSALNPLGSGLVFPPLIIGQVAGMALVGLMGGVTRPFFWKKYPGTRRILFLGVSGFLLTFIFDSITTLSYPVSAGFDLPQTLALYISGIGFTLLHQVSNFFVFTLGIPRVLRYLAE